MKIDISNYEEAFLTYAQNFIDVENAHKDMLQLKVHHSLEVLQHTKHLVATEATLQPYGRACLLAALFHDVARFYQFERWRTFKDAPGRNHGLLGAKILRQQQFLANESSLIQKQVIAAVAMHNRFSIPKHISHDIMLITQAVRDADKLDIIRIMAEHFSQKTGQNQAVVFYANEDPLGWSPKIIQDVLENRLAFYSDIQYVNDFKLLLGSWLHDLTFASSKKMFASSGHMDCILQDLPLIPQVQQAKQYIKKLLQQALCETNGI